jgi:hypothetical protein
MLYQLSYASKTFNPAGRQGAIDTYQLSGELCTSLRDAWENLSALEKNIMIRRRNTEPDYEENGLSRRSRRSPCTE